MLKSYNEVIEDKTYSIKIGKHVPNRGVNLAYVDSPKIYPSKNISISSSSMSNRETYEEKTLMPDREMRLIASEHSETFQSDNITMTDQFSLKRVSLEKITPLYYRGELKYNIKLEKNDLLKFESGHMTQTITEISNMEFSISTDSTFIYKPTATKIQFIKSEESAMTSKIIIEKVNITEGKVLIYTDRPVKNVIVKYNSTDTDSPYKQEVLNTYPFFSRDDDLDQYLKVNKTLATLPDFNNKLTDTLFALRQEGEEYAAYVPTQNVVADENTRKMFNFRYKVEVNKKLKYNIANKGTIKIGVYCINDNGTKDIGDAMAAIQSKVEKMPSFITFENPHPPYASQVSGNQKTTDLYWKINLDMPPEQYRDYDVIIIGGEGEGHLAQYNDYFKDYLSNGGSLWIDNCGVGGNALILESNLNDPEGPFIVGVNFSDTVSESTRKIIGIDNIGILSRYSKIGDIPNEQINIGYQSTSPIMTKESYDLTGWNTIIKYETSNRPAVMYKRAFTRGLVVVSNCAVMFGALEEQAFGVDNELAVNIITVLGEDAWYTTPWINDYVLHKDQVFNGEMGNAKGTYRTQACPLPALYTGNVAAKRIEDSPSALIDKYHRITIPTQSETYFFHVEEFDPIVNGYIEKDVSQMNAKKIQGKTKLDPLYVYTISPPGAAFDIDALGFSNGQIQLFNQAIEFSYMVRPYIYSWSDLAGANMVTKIYGDAANIGVNSAGESILTIKKSDGLKKLEPLAISAPGTPAGEIWSNKDKVNYEVALANFSGSSNAPVQYLNKPITITLQNSKTGELYTDINGTPSISYEELFSTENVGNISIYASTTYQAVTATKRVFAAKSLVSAPIKALLPDEIDTKDQWFVRLTNGRHVVEKSTLLHSPKLLYKINDFHDQMFMPNEPFKQVKDEQPIYLDYTKLKVGRTAVYIKDINITNEALVNIGNRTYKSRIYRNWDIGSVVVKKGIPNEVLTTLADLRANYTVDYEEGAVVLDSSVTLSEGEILTASFKCANFNVKKFDYKKENKNKEMLSIISSEANKTIYKVPSNVYNVRIYQLINGVETPLTSTYDLDADLGFITINSKMESPVYADYKYFSISNVRVSGIDVSSGIIYTVDEIKITDEIRVDYYYEETCFDYKGYYNGNTFVKLDLNPSTGHYVTKLTPTIVEGKKVIKVDEIPTSSIVDQPIYLYMLPSLDSTLFVAKVVAGIVNFDGKDKAYIEKTTTSGHIPAGAIGRSSGYYQNIIENSSFINKLIFIGADLDLENLAAPITRAALMAKFNSVSSFPRKLSSNEKIMPVSIVSKATSKSPYDYITCYIYNKSNIMHTFNKDELDKAVKYKNAIKIADVSVKQKASYEDVVVMDGRVRGGGITPKLSQAQIAKLYPEIYDSIMNFWDIGTWDGTPYQKNGVTIITLPASVRDRIPNNESHDPDKYIRSIIDKYIAFGIQYIVQYK